VCSDEEREVLDYHSQQTEEERNRAIVGVPITLATNGGASVALTGRAGRGGPLGSVSPGGRELSGGKRAQTTRDAVGIRTGSGRDERDEGEEEEAERGKLHVDWKCEGGRGYFTNSR